MVCMNMMRYDFLKIRKRFICVHKPPVRRRGRFPTAVSVVSASRENYSPTARTVHKQSRCLREASEFRTAAIRRGGLYLYGSLLRKRRQGTAYENREIKQGVRQRLRTVPRRADIHKEKLAKIKKGEKGKNEGVFVNLYFLYIKYLSSLCV